MEFSCSLEKSSENPTSLTDIVLALDAAGYTLKSQKQESTSEGKTRFHISARSKAEKSRQSLEADLASLSRCTVVNLKLGAPVSRTSAPLDAAQALKKIGQSYPKIAQIVKNFAASVSEDSRASELATIGAKVGASIYTRDYSLGSPLPMPAALNRVLAPALKEFSPISVSGNTLTLNDCPFCAKKAGDTTSCEFVTGFIKGFMDKNPATPNSSVEETTCGSGSGSQCTFTVIA